MSDAERAALRALREIVAMLDSVGDFTLSSATRFGETDDVVKVEFAKGCWPTSCPTRESVARMLTQWKRDHPDAHFHKTPKVTESPSLARRKVIADKRQRWLDLYGSHVDTLRRLLAEHDIDAGWRSSYSTTWRREVPCSVDDLTHDKVMARMMGEYLSTIAPPDTVPSRSVECSGARDRFHVNTEQAGRVAAASYGPIDGLEAALWCDYACSACQADARRMTMALGDRLEQGLCVSGTKPEVLQSPHDLAKVQMDTEQIWQIVALLKDDNDFTQSDLAAALAIDLRTIQNRFREHRDRALVAPDGVARRQRRYQPSAKALEEFDKKFPGGICQSWLKEVRGRIDKTRQARKGSRAGSTQRTTKRRRKPLR